MEKTIRRRMYQAVHYAVKHPRKSPDLHVEIYNLESGEGYTFPCRRVSLCGEILRIQSPRNFNDWYFVVYSTDNRIEFRDQLWTDFGVTREPCPYFKIIPFKTAERWLQRQ